MKSDNVQLIPVGQPVGPLKWEMSVNGGKSQPHASYPVLGADHETDHDFSFTIRNPGAIKFAKADPFCAQMGTAKPTSCDTNAFTWEMKSGALVVHDHNPAVGSYTYVINFNGPPQLDPVIRNGGCCIGVGNRAYSLTTVMAYSALALLLIVVLILAGRMFVRRSDDTMTPS